MCRRLLIVFIGMGLLVAGCTLAPEYQRPAAPVPASWPRGAAYTDAQSPSEMPVAQALKWQDFFTDEHLKEIVEITLNNNRDLRLAALNVERARAIYGIQRAELYPALNAAAGGSKLQRSADLISSGDPRTTEQYNIDLGIAAWEIDFFGRIRSLKDQALEVYLSTEQARRSAQIILLAEVARVYMALAADRENLKLARATLEAQQASYRLIEKLYNIGISTEIDLRRVQTQVEAAKRDVPRYIQLTAQDKNALDLLAGTPVPDNLLPQGLDNVSPPRMISPGLSSEVLLQRPDILAAEHRLKASNAFIGAARAAFFPRISLTAAMGTASDELSGLFGSDTDTWSFSPRITMPIFDARVWAALRVSKADQKIILTRYEKAIQTAFREVADALATQGTIDQQVSAQEALVHAAEETYRLSNRRYTIGIDDYLSVLDAHRALYLQRQILTSLQFTKLANQVQLYATLGGGALSPEDQQ